MSPFFHDIDMWFIINVILQPICLAAYASVPCCSVEPHYHIKPGTLPKPKSRTYLEHPGTFGCAAIYKASKITSRKLNQCPEQHSTHQLWLCGPLVQIASSLRLRPKSVQSPYECLLPPSSPKTKQ